MSVSPKHHIAVIGAGYVGLVSAVCLAKWGHAVKVFDTNPSKRKKLQEGESPIYEPGLDELLKELVQKNLISFPATIEETLSSTNVAFLAVGTPQSSQQKANLDFVFQAAEDIAKSAPDTPTPYHVIIKSTVPSGTSEQVQKILERCSKNKDFNVISNPEFLREGKAIYDFENPDRVIVGLLDKDTTGRTLIKELYQRIPQEKILFMSPKSAELSKYAANAFLALKVGYINEIAELCENIGADVIDVAHSMGLDHRIGIEFLKPGPGVGGSCFPKDTNALASMAREHKMQFSIIDAAIESNLNRIQNLSEKVSNILSGNVSKKKIAVLGLTFKANTDDVRTSPALVLIENLLKLGATINAFDPEGVPNAQANLKEKLPSKDFASINWFTEPLSALKNVDAAVIVTEWEVLKDLSPEKIKEYLKKNTLIDFRNLFDPVVMGKLGISYYGIGRSNIKPSEIG